MKNKSLIYLVMALVAVNLSVSIYNSYHTPKIAYVRSQDLIYGYTGMKEAQSSYEQKTNVWQANVDTLEIDYRRALSKYNQQFPTLSEEQRTEQEVLLRNQQTNFQQYTQAIDMKAKEEDEKMTKGVLNQINSFVEGYGKDKGYDAIFGTTLSGNLLYGRNTIDITSEVLEALNNNYKEGSPVSL